jgi:hypothetical protein
MRGSSGPGGRVDGTNLVGNVGTCKYHVVHYHVDTHVQFQWMGLPNRNPSKVEASSGHDYESVKHSSNPAELHCSHLSIRCRALGTM